MPPNTISSCLSALSALSAVVCADGFLLPGGFLRVGPTPAPTPAPDFSVFVLPGTLVPPSSYEAVGLQIGSLCRSINITTDVSIAKFTLNAGHRFEARAVSENIKREARSENIVVVGHSASAVVGAEVARLVDAAGFVQWCGTFNSNGDFPWDCVDPYRYDMPMLSILSEQDSMLSFATAIREFRAPGNNTSSVIPTSIRDSGHFSGIYTDDREFEELPRSIQSTIERTGTSVDDLFDMSAVAVSWRISEFIGFLNGSPRSAENIRGMESRFRSRFGELASTHCRDDVKTMLYGSGNTPGVKHVHSVDPPGLLYALLYAAFPGGRSLLVLFTVVMPFIFSYPSEDRSISMTPMVNPLPGATLANPAIWAKIPRIDESSFCREVNSDTFERALADVSEEDRSAYFNYGKPMVFGRDARVPRVPGCGLVWVFKPLVVEENDSYARVSSPVIRMKSTLNTKLISRKQCLEWILVKCFK
jgi:hypothetical protein